MAAFPEIDRIPYEGPESKNPLAFRWYNADEIVEGKTMRLSDLRGNVVVLMFSYTGCGPCERMYPDNRKLVEKQL